MKQATKKQKQAKVPVCEADFTVWLKGIVGAGSREEGAVVSVSLPPPNTCVGGGRVVLWLWLWLWFWLWLWGSGGGGGGGGAWGAAGGGTRGNTAAGA